MTRTGIALALASLLIGGGTAHSGARFAPPVARGGGAAVPAARAPAIAPPALPLPAGARIVGIGHSYIDRQAQSPQPHSATYPNMAGGAQILARGVLPYVDALDRAEAGAQDKAGRFGFDICFEATGTRQVNSATSQLSCSHQGFYGDTIEPGAVAGKPGTLARTAYLLSRAPAIAYLDIGINDIRAGRSAAQVIAGLDRQVALMTASGLWVVLQTLSWPQDPGYGYSDVAAVNAWILAQEGRAGVKVADTTALDGTAAAPAANFGNDRLHLSPIGARARALIVKDVLQAMVAPAVAAAPDALDAANLFPGKRLPGTTGTLTNASGTVAAGFNLARVTGTSAYVGAKRTMASGNDCQSVTVTPNDNGAGWHIFGLKPVTAATFASLTLAAGDWYEVSLTVRFDAWPGWNVSASDQPVAALYDEQSTSNLNDLYWSSADFVAYPGRATVLRMVGQVQPGATQMRWSNRWLQVYHLSGTGGSGTMEACAPMLRKIADPRSAWNLP